MLIRTQNMPFFVRFGLALLAYTLLSCVAGLFMARLIRASRELTFGVDPDPRSERSIEVEVEGELTAVEATLGISDSRSYSIPA